MKSASQAALVRYPRQAIFGRVVPKNKLYEHSSITKRLKDLFVEQVEQIIWEYKLAPETINLPSRPGVPEIQIFTIRLKTPELHRDVLRCIDSAVQFPIIFELSYDNRTQVIACYRRLNESDPGRWVLSGYFATDWLPSDCERAAMPLALDLTRLYEELLRPLIPLPTRLQESLFDLILRAESAAAKKREIEKMTCKLTQEKQFNRKVRINAALRALKAELSQLSGEGVA